MPRSPLLTRRAVLAASALAACRPPRAAGVPRLALVMKSLANEFYQGVEGGARRHQAETGGYDLIAAGIRDEVSVGRQVDLVDTMVARGVDAMVIVPADSKALVSAVKRAMAAGVVVVNVVERLDAGVLRDKGLRVPYVGPSNRRGAKVVGDYLASRLGPGAPVAIIEGLPTVESSRDRRAGFEEAARDGRLQLLDVQSGQWDMGKAAEITASLLTAHPQLKAVLCANDSMALGAAAALRNAGKLRQVQVVGFDNIQAVQPLLRAGDMLATADMHADRLAVYGIEYALEIMRTKASPEDRETPVDLITTDAVKSARI